MPSITISDGDRPDVELHYTDAGTGRPVVLIHGWPLSGRAWEGQVPDLVDAGYRVITYDRRGFGESSQPWEGYDYDTFAADLDALLTELDVTDATLVGFSMGGGEVARYAGTYGTARLAQVVFASAVPPYLWKSDDNPDGAVDDDLANWFHDGLTGDRPKFLADFLRGFFTPEGGDAPLVSDAQIDYHAYLAAGASPKGTLDCTVAFATTDFRDDLAKIDVPTLVIHGDADSIVPLEASGARTAQAIAGSRLVVIEGAPHGVTVSHKDEWNSHLLAFLAS
ncbi:alpha/beta fold hydrolase [Agromyces atrinae]|uniref:Alpha/beta hydrolase n=1 Tax=Agromyces atrinae TaxID=592376 RepID=A0A4Q2M3F2_9MICO|nr:alpha/beta hydrolase [Agromyces atrinae]NYD65557.1 pimeloyl-ACP methyl ester carboxylesterase [Agromyces atrinae]RXZ85717.1 alpha/beta hydrolase [Agromyces atrinae]